MTIQSLCSESCPQINRCNKLVDWRSYRNMESVNRQLYGADKVVPKLVADNCFRRWCTCYSVVLVHIAICHRVGLITAFI